MNIKFNLLGRVTIEVDGVSIEFGTPKMRKLMTLLVINRKQYVQASAVANELWPDSDRGPRDSVQTLYGYVSRLRQQLRVFDADITIEARSSAYRLDGSIIVDYDEFNDLIRVARVNLESGDLEHASVVLRSALGIWRGPALLDMRDSERLGFYATSLENDKLQAHHLLMDTELKLGRHLRIIGELESLVRENPFQEGFYAMLMVALYRSGRTSDALSIFSSLREKLIEEFGSEPGKELSEIQSGILNQDPILLQPYRTTREGTFLAAPRMLPASPQFFVGRANEYEEVRKMVEGGEVGSAPRLIIVTGPPGIGKTAFSVFVSHALMGNFPDGQLYVDLDRLDPDGDPVGATLAMFLRFLGVPSDKSPASIAERAALFRSITAERQILMLVDGVKNPEQLSALLPNSAESVVIGVGRSQLQVLTGLQIRLEPLTDDESIELLSRSIGVAKVESEVEAVRKLVQTCGGLPLAIRVAAEMAVGGQYPAIADLVASLTNEV